MVIRTVWGYILGLMLLLWGAYLGSRREDATSLVPVLMVIVGVVVMDLADQTRALAGRIAGLERRLKEAEDRLGQSGPPSA